LAVYDADGNHEMVLDGLNRPADYALPLGDDFKVAKAAVAAAQVAEAVKVRDEQRRQQEITDRVNELGPITGGRGLR
jgi:hypothetical protein